MNDAPVRIQFALISHTNNGKTTLARTLIGADVGEVRDAAHVTIFSESHTLLRTDTGDTLELWDTPGFGDSVRLLRRLAMAGNPIGWFLREVFDRYRDRPFWLSQQALRSAKDAADVVLYLVNSAEAPRDAGYLPAEMKILEWLDKPVIVLLNQLGRPRPAPEEQAEQARWKQHLDQFPHVRAVLALDAFARCWVHERVFYETVAKVIPQAQQAGYQRLLAAWEAHNVARFREAMQLLSNQLHMAAADNEPVEVEEKGLLKSALHAVGLARGGQQQRQEKAMASLIDRLNRHIGETTVRLLALHKLDTKDAPAINARVRDNFSIRAPVDQTQAGLLGAIVSGAATGLSADLMAGGLSFGAGALLGGVVGALTMAGAAWGFNTTTSRNVPSVQFADAFLHTLLVGCVLRYLAVAHFGRGRGSFVEGEAPAFWQQEAERAVAAEIADPAAFWAAARVDKAALAAALTRITADVLGRLYPGTTISI